MDRCSPSLARKDKSDPKEGTCQQPSLFKKNMLEKGFSLVRLTHLSHRDCVVKLSQVWLTFTSGPAMKKMSAQELKSKVAQGTLV